MTTFSYETPHFTVPKIGALVAAWSYYAVPVCRFLVAPKPAQLSRRQVAVTCSAPPRRSVQTSVCLVSVSSNNSSWAGKSSWTNHVDCGSTT